MICVHNLTVVLVAEVWCSPRFDPSSLWFSVCCVLGSSRSRPGGGGWCAHQVNMGGSNVDKQEPNRAPSAAVHDGLQVPTLDRERPTKPGTHLLDPELERTGRATAAEGAAPGSREVSVAVPLCLILWKCCSGVFT